MKLNLDHLNMTVASLKQSEIWYKKVFGFERVEGGVRNGRAWSIVKKDESMLCLYEDAALSPAYAHPTKDHNLNHFGIRIRDRAEWEAVVAREKLEVAYGGPVAYPHSQSWYVTDPSGHEIEVSYWPEGVTF